MSGNEPETPFDEILDTLKKAVAALRDGNVPYLLGGGLAIWARGGPEREHDLDFMIKEEDADRALRRLADAGMTPEKPPRRGSTRPMTTTAPWWTSPSRRDSS